MVDSILFELLEQHPVICAEPFCQWAGIGHGPRTSAHTARLRHALRVLLAELTTMQRATHGGNYDALGRFLRRADMNAAGLLGPQRAAAYEWLRRSWCQPHPPPDVVHAWKAGLGRLISWVRLYSHSPARRTTTPRARAMQRAA